MMQQKNLRVSIVIPVYNEAEHLAACLEAIANQTVTPHEVIVVDNNSTDGSVAIAQSFDFVAVIHESRQGVVNARNAGFDAVRGDIIGRIDADSLIAPDWVASINELFTERHDLAAATGKVRYYGMALSTVFDEVDLRVRRRMARLLGREVAMQGANTALRVSAWHDVKPYLCNKAGQHEDHDLGIHLSQRGQTVIFDERLVTSIDSRRVESSWLEFCRYALTSPRTYAQHGLRSRRHMYPVVALAIIFHSVLKLLRRGYNSRVERFSWRQLFAASPPVRVNPVTFVD
jgi:cellulose synthase/poly-beta-1,6-N-acetylglucosamine synthase-like glycosyltransferase